MQPRDGPAAILVIIHHDANASLPVDRARPNPIGSTGIGSARAIRGSLIGTAIGDALGLPFEGLSARRVAKLRPDVRHRFVFGRGMVSDDTEHAVMTAAAVSASSGDPEMFERELARAVRSWFLAAPAGIGLATLRSCLKLCVGIGPTRSGVFSAGNGPCMRAPVLGAAIGDSDLLRELVMRSTRITHTDPMALAGALAVAAAAQVSILTQAEGNGVMSSAFMELDRKLSRGCDGLQELDGLLERAIASVDRGQGTQEFASAIGLSRGVTGYVLHTVPVVIHAWLSHPRDIDAATLSVIRCGGDTDTTAAILGGIVGAGIGPEKMPRRLVDGLVLWPWRIRGVNFEEGVAGEVGHARQPAWPLAISRNLVFLALVLGHGARRLLPPY